MVSDSVSYLFFLKISPPKVCFLRHQPRLTWSPVRNVETQLHPPCPPGSSWLRICVFNRLARWVCTHENLRGGVPGVLLFTVWPGSFHQGSSSLLPVPLKGENCCSSSQVVRLSHTCRWAESPCVKSVHQEVSVSSLNLLGWNREFPGNRLAQSSFVFSASHMTTLCIH